MIHRWPQSFKAVAVAISLGAWLAASLMAQAAEPQFAGMSPYGFQRGTEIETTFRGNRLGDAQQLLLYSPGVEVSALTPINDSSFKAKLKIAPDCRLGIHALRLRTATGLSNLRTFSIGALPEVAQIKPNNEFEHPQSVPLNCTVNGVVLNEEVNYYAVEAKKGDRVTAEIEGLRLGVTFFDPYVAILDSKRFELARCDDSPLLRQDSECSIIAPEDGKYVIQVRETSFGGNNDCIYRLHVGTYPRPTVVYPGGGRPGETLIITWLGDAAGPRKQTITLPAITVPAAGTAAELFAQDERGIAPSPNRVRVVDLPGVVKLEPSSDPAHATPCPAPGVANGIIEKPGETDFFKFHAKKGQAFDVRVYAREILRSPLDSVLTILRASNGQAVASNDDSFGPDSYLRFNAPEDDDYLIAVTDQLRGGGPDFVYRVEITVPSPALTMRLPERQQYVSQTLVVPKKNRMAIMVAAERTNFGGDLQLAFAGLPSGLTFDNEPFTGDRNELPVLFTAADIPTTSVLADLSARPADPKLKIEGHLSQRTMLVRGQNNQEVWGHTADRMAIAVSNELPFKIDIVQPKVPLVKNGSMNLKIVATRAAGFAAPISLSLLYNPPGVSSSASVSIPEKQSEAVIPLTANGGAPIRKWKIVAIGRSPFAGAAVEAASQLADLEIADQFVNLGFPRAAVEKGKEVDYVVTVEKKKDFDGEATVELLGLPAGATSLPAKITKTSTSISFKVKTAPDARPGKYPSLVCRVTIVQAGEPITHTLGSGELRIDEPLPPKPTAAAPKPAAQPSPAASAKPPEKKPLSRLEQLRLERQQQSGK
ncbi:MAG TPA: PPC domain-containing protein [Pirellulales bacterium]|nr:PPC domain-containing protein [Pirellulales bacterium]